MLYSDEVNKINDSNFMQNIISSGIDSIFLVVKDYNGKWLTLDTIKEISLVLNEYRISFYGWICTQTEGYEGELTTTYLNEMFLEKEWSVVDSNGKDTLDNPLPCDLGLEQFACPNNANHNDYVVEMIKKYELFFAGFLFDFVRFPLEKNYCFCNECNKIAEKMYNTNILNLSDYQRYMLKENSITNLVENLNDKVNIKKTFLVWPDFFAKNISRTQNYKKWKVDAISPMIYRTIWPSEKFLKKVAFRKTIANELPLYLLDDNLKNKVDNLKKYNENFILTHYHLNNVPLKNTFKLKVIPYMIIKHCEYLVKKYVVEGILKWKKK